MARPVVRTRRARAARFTLLALVLVGGPAIILPVLGLETFETYSPAMEPTLLIGDRLVLERSIALRWSDPSPGDVVVWYSAQDGLDAPRRVIGVPGDRIEIRDDVLYRNGAPIPRRLVGPCAATGSADEPTDCVTIEESIGGRTWRTWHSALSAPESMSERTVPPGTVFLLGDHRDRSNDSRNPRLGFIPFASLRRATVIYWSEYPGRVGHWIE